MSGTAAHRPLLPVAGLLTAAVMFLLDRMAKYVLIELIMRPPGVSETPFFSATQIEILPVFDLRVAWNTGISFSMFNSGTLTMLVVLVAVQLAITAGLLWYMWRQANQWMQIAAGL